MDAVDGIRCNIHCTLETEGHIGAPQIIVNGLRQRYDIQSFLAQQVRSLVGAVTTENYKAVQLQLVIVLLHGFHFVQPVGIRILDRLERGPRFLGSCRPMVRIPEKSLSVSIRKLIDQSSVAIHLISPLPYR